MFTASQVSLEKFRRWLYRTLLVILVIPSFTPVRLADAAPSIDPQPGFPIRAAFYYAWFPESWKQQGFDPFTNYTPSLGFYNSGSQTLIQQHIAAMGYAGIEAGIASWWGQGSVTDGRMPALLQAAAGTTFRWSIYHEPESEGDPSVAQLTSDLTYIRDRYGSDPSFLRIGSRFVVFVYANGADACGMADRWKQANTVGAYIVLKVFPGYHNCASQPDGWHQYSPAVTADSQAGHSYAIAPGFWKRGDPVTLPRNPSRWHQNICNMIASGAPLQLITTFNEWGEGTSVESAQEWASSSGYGSYLDALHHVGNPATALLPGVVNILRTTPNPLNLLNVNFTVTFSENVTGVNASDFALTTTGVSGAAVSGVSGSGCVYTVTVNTGSGNGTLSLNLVDNDSIKDSGGNPLGGLGVANGNFTGLGTYTITKDVETHVGGNLIGAYALGPSQSKRDSYAQNNGPVKVTSTNAVPIIAAERDAWLANGAVQSFSEMMGLPADQLTDTYYFPWYNNLTMNTQLRFANLGNTGTNVTVTIAGVPQSVIPLAAGESTRVDYPINAGPVKVESSGGVPIIVAERDAWLVNGVVQSFSEMMGLPGDQLSDTYYFPWYNNVTMDTQLRFANLGNTDTAITVTIAAMPQPVIPLAVGESTRVSYPINAGPVQVQSSGGVPIIVAERDAWLINGVVRSFSEMMGLPADQLTDTYYFPWYNNLTMDTQLRFANLGNASTNITVTIAGVTQPVIPLAAGVSTRVSYPVNNGPVKVQSSGGVPIIVAERDAWLVNGAVRSFSEMMGLPGNQLSDTYYFPWYNNLTMDTQLRFAVP